jgi:hypothetical protein
MKALFISRNLIGDSLYVGPALRKWILTHDIEIKRFDRPPQDEIIIQTIPDHVAPLYQGMVRDLIQIKTVFERPIGNLDFEHEFNVSKAFDLSDKKKQHIADSYAELLGVKLEGGNERLKPIYIPDDNKWMEGPHETLGSLKGAILISMFSASCTSRDANTKGLPPNKMLLSKDNNGEWKSYAKWKPMLKLIKEQYPDNPIRFVGAPTDVLPEELKEYGTAMFGVPLNRLALIMQKAKLILTIDNGMSHLAASQEAPTFLLYPRCLGVHYILPIGNPNLEWVQVDPVYVNPAQLAFSLKHAITRFKAEEK